MRLHFWIICGLVMLSPLPAFAQQAPDTTTPPTDQTAEAPAQKESAKADPTPSQDAAKDEAAKAVEEKKETDEDKGMTAEEFEAKLGFQTGEITIGQDLALLKLPPEYRFIGPQSSSVLLTQVWGNPASSAEGVLGMIFPTDQSPLDPNTWGVVISYDEDGYVDDKDASSIDYSKLLNEMKEGSDENNAERIKEGFDPVELVGWAEPPSYNAQTHKLFWAKELKFGQQSPNSLNYNVRVLGRKGVLVLNAVSEMDKLAKVKKAMDQVINFVDFKPGNRYTDYVAGTDKVAAYGLAGLIAGTVAMKAGFFKVLLVSLLAAKKAIIVGGVAIAAFFAKLFKKAPAQG